jgi:hypothetical protein
MKNLQLLVKMLFSLLVNALMTSMNDDSLWNFNFIADFFVIVNRNVSVNNFLSRVSSVSVLCGLSFSFNVGFTMRESLANIFVGE